MISIILYPISIIPVILIYFWIKKSVYKDDAHRVMAKSALINGFKSTILGVIIGVLLLIIQWFVFKDESVAKTFFHNFFVLALSEELAKAYFLGRLIKKQDATFSWLDITIYMVIVAIGFDILESALYAVGASPLVIIIRGISCPHLGYGFIMGYLIGKAKKAGKRLYYILALVIPWILHGSYDFCVGYKATETDYLIMYTAIGIAVVSLILTISFVIYIINSRNNPKYTEAI